MPGVPFLENIMETALRTQALMKIYRLGKTEVHTLRSVDLTIQPGEFVVLLGISGSDRFALGAILACNV